LKHTYEELVTFCEGLLTTAKQARDEHYKENETLAKHYVEILTSQALLLSQENKNE